MTATARTHGWVDYQDRMARVLAHVHDHLDTPLDLHTLAEIAHLSPCHWHRVYHALYGETLAATVRRLRLHRASGDLLHTPSLSVAQVARRCGYPNAQTFTRAFRAAYGQTPADYRRQPHPPALGEGPAPHRPAPDAPGPVTVCELPRVHLAGLDHRGPYMNIGKAFEACFPPLAAGGWVGPDTRWMAVYLDDPFSVPPAQLRARAGLSVPPEAEVPAPLQRFTLGGCRCAVLRYRGPYAHMREAYRWLYGEWLVAQGIAAGEAPVFEVYLNHPRDTAPTELLTDICLPLAPAPASH